MTPVTPVNWSATQIAEMETELAKGIYKVNPDTGQFYRGEKEIEAAIARGEPLEDLTLSDVQQRYNRADQLDQTMKALAIGKRRKLVKR